MRIFSFTVKYYLRELINVSFLLRSRRVKPLEAEIGLFKITKNNNRCTSTVLLTFNIHEYIYLVFHSIYLKQLSLSKLVIVKSDFLVKIEVF